MNRIIRIIFFTLFIVSTTYSQSFSEFGVKMGVLSSKHEQKILSQIIGSTTYFNNTRVGPTMGLFLRYLDNDHFNIESEILYLQKGGEEKFEITSISHPAGTGEFIISDIQFDYLSFQTSIRPNYSYKEVNLYLLAGGTISYLLGVKGGFKPKGDFKSYSFGYSIGFGIVFQDVLKMPILFEALMNSDLTNIYESSGLEYKHKTYLLRLGFIINNFSL